MAHVSEEKKKVVNEFVKLIKEYPIIGALNMENLPSKQVQKMRETLRDTVVIKMTKRRLMKVIFEKAKKDKPNIELLTEHLHGMPALLFTKENPFAIFKTLQKNKSTAPARAGQKAPKEIMIPAGATSFAPGPIIGQLGAVGIMAGVENGKVAIKKNSVVAKEGAVISADLAGILTRLGIEPMEIGLDLTAVYENGQIYTKKILAVDEKEYCDNINKAHSWAFNLAVEAGIYNKEVIDFILTKASSDAFALAIAQDIVNKETAGHVLAKAENQMLTLKTEINI